MILSSEEEEGGGSVERKIATLLLEIDRKERPWEGQCDGSWMTGKDKLEGLEWLEKDSSQKGGG